MAFLAQVQLSDVPTLAHDRNLLSFHFCLECTYAGKMSYGRGDEQNRGYAVTRFANSEGAPDELGIVAEGCLPSVIVDFSDVDELPGLEDVWALDLKYPDELLGGEDLDENIGHGLVHVARCKLGGWPSWQQTPEWPTCHDGRRMSFVMQIDYEFGKASPWGGGGYACLFVCGTECDDRAADLVLQHS
jgi:hypothetical protein